MLGGLAVLLILRALIAPSPSEAGDATAASEARADAMRRHGRAIGMLLIGVGYLLVVTTLGYAVSIALLMAATALYNGGGRSWRIVLFAIVGAAAFHLIFVVFLGIPLPLGIWPALIS